MLKIRMLRGEHLVLLGACFCEAILIRGLAFEGFYLYLWNGSLIFFFSNFDQPIYG